MTNAELMEKAIEAMTKAYAPYSKFTVGAAILTKSGKVYTGANIENASYGATMCAERTAVGVAMMAGEREFTKMAVVANSKEFVPPCGICRQVLSEFCTDEAEILCGNENGHFRAFSFKELFPFQFINKQFTNI